VIDTILFATIGASYFGSLAEMEQGQMDRWFWRIIAVFVYGGVSPA
jgi:hypothetical protein